VPEKDYTYNQQLLLEAVKSTYGIPTAAFSVLGVTAGYFALPALRLFWETIAATPEKVGEILDNAADEIRKQVIQTIKPAVQFRLDVRACLEAALVGSVWVPAFSDGRFAGCLASKGYGSKTIAAARGSIVGGVLAK